MKYPPTSERGSPVSACQRSGSVNVDIGTGTTRTLAEGGSRSAANAADQPCGTGAAAATAASTAKASSAAAVPSATRQNRSGSADSSSGRPCSQYQGSLIAGWWCQPNSRVPPSENTPSTTQATAAARAGSRRQQAIAAPASTTTSGQPR